MNDKGETTEAFTCPNAVPKYGAPKDVEFNMSDGLNGFKRTLFAVKDVTYIALTEPDSQTVILIPLGILIDILLIDT